MDYNEQNIISTLDICNNEIQLLQKKLLCMEQTRLSLLQKKAIIQANYYINKLQKFTIDKDIKTQKYIFSNELLEYIFNTEIIFEIREFGLQNHINQLNETLKNIFYTIGFDGDISNVYYLKDKFFEKKYIIPACEYRGDSWDKEKIINCYQLVKNFLPEIERNTLLKTINNIYCPYNNTPIYEHGFFIECTYKTFWFSHNNNFWYLTDVLSHTGYNLSKSDSIDHVMEVLDDYYFDIVEEQKENNKYNK